MKTLKQMWIYNIQRSIDFSFNYAWSLVGLLVVVLWLIQFSAIVTLIGNTLGK